MVAHNMGSNHIGLADHGQRVAASTWGICDDCGADIWQKQPHTADCIHTREAEEVAADAELAKQNAERAGIDEVEIDRCPVCEKPTHATEGNEDGVCAGCIDSHAGVRAFEDPATALKAQLVKGETVYRVYLTSDDESLLVREAEATTEQLARSAALTLAKARPGERYTVTKETIEQIWGVCAG